MSGKGKQTKSKKVGVSQATPSTAKVTPNSLPKPETSGVVIHVQYTSTPTRPQPAVPQLPVDVSPYKKQPPGGQNNKNSDTPSPRTSTSSVTSNKVNRNPVQHFIHLLQTSDESHFYTHDAFKGRLPRTKQDFYLECLELIDNSYSPYEALIFLENLQIEAKKANLHIEKNERLQKATHDKKIEISPPAPQVSLIQPGLPIKNIIDLQNIVFHALKNEIKRLNDKQDSWKLSWIYSYFFVKSIIDWYLQGIERKKDALGFIQSKVINTKEPEKISEVVTDVVNNLISDEIPNTEKQNTQNALSPYYNTIRERRHSFNNDKPDTINNLEKVFKPIQRVRAC